MSGLCTDLYEIRMAASYLRRGMAAPATFSLFVRALPPERGFLVAAGLADCLAFLETFQFSDDELGYLRGLGLPARDLSALARLRFTGQVWAVPEGTVVFAGEPLLEVTAPIAEAQLVETALLNFVTYQTAVASKAARCRIAARGAELIDFAARRTHGLEAAMAVARVTAIVGFGATSYVAAARRYQLRAAGTMAHSYIEAFPDERAAFRAFAQDFPDAAILLVDTYDTVAGVRAAVATARELDGRRLVGIRLDSGDLGALAVRARQLLDAAGLRHARIVASGSLDEYAIAELARRRVPIDAYGVGTKVGVSADAPSLDSAYKLVQYGDRPVLKLSPGKQTLPGPKQVYRDPSGPPDLLALREEPPPPGRQPLLVQVMAGGQRVGPPDTVAAARRRLEADLGWLPDRSRQIWHPVRPRVRPSPRLAGLSRQLERSRLTATDRVATAGQVHQAPGRVDGAAGGVDGVAGRVQEAPQPARTP